MADLVPVSAVETIVFAEILRNGPHAGTIIVMAGPISREYRPGQFLFHEGVPSECLYLIKRGTVAVRKRKGAAYVEIARVYANEVLGELSFFDRQPRSAAAVALTEVEAMEIKFDSLDKIWQGVPDYMKTIMASVAERLRKANDTIRRLQKGVVNEGGEATTDGSDGSSASDVLAALDSVPTDDSSNT